MKNSSSSSVLVPPEVTIQSSSSRLSSSEILLNCTIIARPLTSVKWRQNRREILSNIQQIQINEYTIQLILRVHVRQLTEH